MIWLKREEENFFEQGSTAQISLMRFNKSGFSSIVEQTPQSQKNQLQDLASYFTAQTARRDEGLIWVLYRRLAETIRHSRMAVAIRLT